MTFTQAELLAMHQAIEKAVRFALIDPTTVVTLDAAYDKIEIMIEANDE